MKSDKELAEDMMSQMHGDNESDHLKADNYLCKVLTELGYHELVKAYQDVGKWYA